MALHLTHPLIIFLLCNLTSTATCAYTLPSTPSRYLAILVHLTLVCIGLSNFQTHVQSSGWVARSMASAIFTSSQVLIDRLVCRKWAYGSTWLGPKKTSQEERAKQSRWEWGSAVGGSVRCIGSEHEAANVPHFDEGDHGFLPLRYVFLAKQLVLIVALSYVNTYVADVRHSVSGAFLSDAKVPFLARIGDVSWVEMATRIRVSLSFWIALFCVLQILYSIASFVGVLFKPSSLPAWRPIFGSLGSAYTIRNFWGKFWHQNTQLNVKGPSNYIAHEILHLQSGTILSRYTKILLAFAVSGAMHVATDIGAGLSLKESGAMRFFCTQTLGILLEDVVQKLYSRYFRRKESGSWGRKVVGYLWVIAFISWSTPAWIFPSTRDGQKENTAVGLAAFKPLMENLW